jgi:hypothetical protein
MLTKTKIALAATLFAATSSAAMAQGFDANMANRYPGYGNAGPSAQQATAPRGVLQNRNVGLTNDQSGRWGASEIDIDRADRASSPYAGGGY